MEKNHEKEKNYIISTSVNDSCNQDEFVIELFSYPEDDTEQTSPNKVIHNFDELICFFESLDQEKDRKLEIKQAQ